MYCAKRYPADCHLFLVCIASCLWRPDPCITVLGMPCFVLLQLIVLTLLFVAAVLGLFVTGHVSALCNLTIQAMFVCKAKGCVQSLHPRSVVL